MEADSDTTAKTNQLPRNPKERASILSQLFFCYVAPVFKKSLKKEIDLEDLYAVLDDHKSDDLGDRMSVAWDKELLQKQRRNSGKEPALFRTIVRVFGGDYALLGVLMCATEFLFRLSQPIFLGGIISYFRNPEADDLNTAYLYAAGFVVVCTANVICTHSVRLALFHLGMKIRLSMSSLVYRKSLRLSQSALGVTTVGLVVNLLSNDVYRMDFGDFYIHYVWVAPLETLVALYFMYDQIGISAVWGVLFLLALIPLQGYLGKKISQCRFKITARTDERVQMMNEIIQGIQVIKMYAWEKPLGRLVEEVRRRELRMIRFLSYTRGIFNSLEVFTTRIAIFVSLVVFALSGNWLTVEKAFVLIAYYNIVRVPLTFFFPLGLQRLAEAFVSIERIEKFLMCDEVEQQPAIAHSLGVTNPAFSGEEKSGENKLTMVDDDFAINCQGVTGKWDSTGSENTLDHVDVRIKQGSLVALIGRVGSGKSSLIQAILKEFPLSSGHISVNGSVSYYSQEAWLFSASVRQNILFGLQMDRARYREVVKMCALERDFAQFEFGDKTIVGERGASVSGGQRARITLARACYRDAAIYLLDDPLSAVDAHVGRHLFEQCMRKFLRGKTVILVTHQLRYLQSADNIVIMDKGRVVASGTYESLKSGGLDFAQMLTQGDAEEEEESAEPEKKTSRTGSKRQSGRSRKSSVVSIAGSGDVQEDHAPKQVEETRKVGTISKDVYAKYVRAMGGFWAFFVVASAFVLTQVATSGCDYFLTYWTKKESARVFQNVTNTGTDYSRYVDIYIFSGLTVATVIIALARSFLFYTLAVNASKALHHAMYTGVTRASMYFFNTNNSGRILNRFSKDMGQVDEVLPPIIMEVFQYALPIVGVVVLVAIVNPFMIIPTVIVGIIYYYIRKLYLLSSRNIMRMDATTRSPVYSHVGASLNGLSTIRSFQAQTALIHEFDQLQDRNSSAWFMFLTTTRAFSFYLDTFSVLFIAVVTLSFFLMDDVDGGNVGLAITQAMSVTGSFQHAMKQFAQMENNMTAVERVVEYQSVDQEEKDTNAKITTEALVNKDWLHSGRIEFVNVVQRYEPSPGAKAVLKDLSFTVEAKEKIGIVGRTGAGKSSLVSAIFRLSYFEGRILVDGVNTQEIPLDILRKNMSIIPQEPVLFSGSVRYNLDPFDEFDDDKLWSALGDVHLHDVVAEMSGGLRAQITGGGSNFSVGQRQLICLARAVLRENRILVMDEATANVDALTDALIQKTIREKFCDCTVLIIAHRLLTVIDADRVLVMDAGRAVEFDSPYNLLKAESGPRIFQSMVQGTGKGLYEQLVAQVEERERTRVKIK